MNEPQFAYDAATRKGVISFPNGHKLTIGNIDEVKAKAFFQKHAAEFMRRDCILHTSACFETRGASNG
jgi:hypothetical protein